MILLLQWIFGKFLK